MVASLRGQINFTDRVLICWSTPSILGKCSGHGGKLHANHRCVKNHVPADQSHSIVETEFLGGSSELSSAALADAGR